MMKKKNKTKRNGFDKVSFESSEQFLKFSVSRKIKGK